MHGIWVNKEVFNCVSKVISELHWFCITSLSYWLKVLVPLFQPIRSETKTNRGLRVHIFLHFVSSMCNNFGFSGLEIATNTVAFATKFFPLQLKYLEKSQICDLLSPSLFRNKRVSSCHFAAAFAKIN